MSKAGFKRMMRERATSSRPAPVQREAPKLTGEITADDHYTQPTDEQLANFVSVIVNAEAATLLGGATLQPLLTPCLCALMLEANPEAKRGWLRRHREFQDAVGGSA